MLDVEKDIYFMNLKKFIQILKFLDLIFQAMPLKIQKKKLRNVYLNIGLKQNILF